MLLRTRTYTLDIPVADGWRKAVQIRKTSSGIQRLHKPSAIHSPERCPGTRQLYPNIRTRLCEFHVLHNIAVLLPTRDQPGSFQSGFVDVKALQWKDITMTQLMPYTKLVRQRLRTASQLRTTFSMKDSRQRPGSFESDPPRVLMSSAQQLGFVQREIAATAPV